MFGRKQNFQEETVIVGIQAGGIEKQKAEAMLYDRFTYLVTKGKKRHFLSQEQANDAYADAVIAVVDVIAKGSFRTENKISTLLHQIFFNKCVDVLRKKSNKDNWSWMPENMSFPDKAVGVLRRMIAEEEVEILVGLMDKLGKSCKDILWDSMYHGYSAKEIASNLGFKSPESVMSQKSTCLKKLKALIAKKKLG
jgi:RNA polymerase sigma-70 factor (ECF subfamily)